MRLPVQGRATWIVQASRGCKRVGCSYRISPDLSAILAPLNLDLSGSHFVRSTGSPPIKSLAGLDGLRGRSVWSRLMAPEVE